MIKYSDSYICEYYRFYFCFDTIKELKAAELDVLGIGTIFTYDLPMLSDWHENLKVTC